MLLDRSIGGDEPLCDVYLTPAVWRGQPSFYYQSCLVAQRLVAFGRCSLWHMVGKPRVCVAGTATSRGATDISG